MAAFLGGRDAFVEDAKMASPLLSALASGNITEATRILQSEGVTAMESPPLSILEDVFPLALTTLAELYDRYGVTGTEKPYFEFSRELWNLMPEPERQIPDMLCTFVYAGCKFNQIDFVKWVLPIVRKHAGIDFTALLCDRQYQYNQLRHSALYYVCKNGSSELYELLVDACGGNSPLSYEARHYDRTFQTALLTGLPTPVIQFGRPGPSLELPHTPTAAKPPIDSPKHASTIDCDPPALYVACKERKVHFVAHVFAGLQPAEQLRILRSVVLYGFIALDDTEAAEMMTKLLQDPTLLASKTDTRDAGGTPSSLTASPARNRPGKVACDNDVMFAAFTVARELETETTSPIVDATTEEEFASRAGSSSLNKMEGILLGLHGPKTAYSGLHVCLFLSEWSADPTYLRRPASLRYFAWCLDKFFGDARFPVLPKMRWTLPSVVETSSGYWTEWSALHSACAATNLFAVSRLVNRQKAALQCIAKWAGTMDPSRVLLSSSFVGGTMMKLPASLYPLRVAAESSFVLRGYETVTFLISKVTANDLDNMLYAQCKGLFSILPLQVKDLCKATSLSLRAFKSASGAPHEVLHHAHAPVPADIAFSAEASILDESPAKPRRKHKKKQRASTGQSETGLMLNESSGRRQRAFTGSSDSGCSVDDMLRSTELLHIDVPEKPQIEITAQIPRPARAPVSAAPRAVRFRPRSASPHSPRITLLRSRNDSASSDLSAAGIAMLPSAQKYRSRTRSEGTTAEVLLDHPLSAMSRVTSTGQLSTVSDRPSSPDLSTIVRSKDQKGVAAHTRQSDYLVASSFIVDSPEEAVTDFQLIASRRNRTKKSTDSPLQPTPSRLSVPTSIPVTPYLNSNEVHRTPPGLSTHMLPAQQGRPSTGEITNHALAGGLHLAQKVVGRRQTLELCVPTWHVQVETASTMCTEFVRLSDCTLEGARHILYYIHDYTDESGLHVQFESVDRFVDAVSGMASVPYWDKLRHIKHLCLAIAALHKMDIVHGCVTPRYLAIKGAIIKLCFAGMFPSLISFCPKDATMWWIEEFISSHSEWLPKEVLEQLDALHEHAHKTIFSRATDIFSLGCVCYFLLFGSHPFGPKWSRERNIISNKVIDSRFTPCLLRDASNSSASPASLGHGAGMESTVPFVAAQAIAAMIQQDPRRRPCITEVLRHPWFWSSKDAVEIIAGFSDEIKRKYGVSPTLPHTSLPHPGQLSTLAGTDNRTLWTSSPAPEVAYLEFSFLWHEGYQADWSARLKLRDKRSERRWRTTSSAGILSTSSSPFASSSPFPSGPESHGIPAEDHKSPENYFWTYKKRGLFALGIVRAIRNIAHAHASDYVADGTFGSVADVADYFIDAFPWLLLEVLHAQSLGRK